MRLSSAFATVVGAAVLMLLLMQAATLLRAKPQQLPQTQAPSRSELFAEQLQAELAARRVELREQRARWQQLQTEAQAAIDRALVTVELVHTDLKNALAAAAVCQLFSLDSC